MKLGLRAGRPAPQWNWASLWRGRPARVQNTALQANADDRAEGSDRNPDWVRWSCSVTAFCWRLSVSEKYTFQVNRAKNRLVIKLSGFFRGSDVEPAMTKLRAALVELEPGFDVITDLSDFVPGSPGAAKAMAQAGQMVKEKGRRNAVRITGGLMTGLMQFQRLLKGVFNEDEVRYAKSIQEADSILDNWEGGA